MSLFWISWPKISFLYIRTILKIILNFYELIVLMSWPWFSSYPTCSIISHPSVSAYNPNTYLAVMKSLSSWQGRWCKVKENKVLFIIEVTNMKALNCNFKWNWLLDLAYCRLNWGKSEIVNTLLNCETVSFAPFLVSVPSPPLKLLKLNKNVRHCPKRVRVSVSTYIGTFVKHILKYNTWPFACLCGVVPICFCQAQP